MKRVALLCGLILVVVTAFLGGYLASRSLTPDLPYQAPTHKLDGSVVVPSFVLPPSEYMSQQAQDLLKLRAALPMGPPEWDQEITERRKRLQEMLSGRVSDMLARYPVKVTEGRIAGVPTRSFAPADGIADSERILINLHGGAFSLCWESCSVLESAPIASLSGLEVISVNYRMAPEAKHPAAVEDVEAVYRALLQRYPPKHIGIYGCSAGGALTAQAASQFVSADLPQPGGIGIFGAGAVRFTSGDSGHIAAYIDGSFPPPAATGDASLDRRITRGYFEGADISDPIISPALHLDVLQHFPPALIITGTRAVDMSPAIVTNSQLLKAGVDSTLIVAEGMGHCYIYMPDFPETQDAYSAIIDFFRVALQ